MSDAPDRPLRVAVLTYSTKARGGVVHSLHLAEALHDLGHRAEIFALAKDGGGQLFRPTRVPLHVAPITEPTGPGLDARIESYIEAYTTYLSTLDLDGFDLFHAQDCVSANALWRLCQQGHRLRWLRTVHHVDEFKSPYLQRCQQDSIDRPEKRVVVSAYWQERLQRELGFESELIFNGVDLSRFTAGDGDRREQARRRLGLGDEWTLLHIGGIEPRKNSIRLLEAFELALPELEERGRGGRLLMAGGETLLDHAPYKEEFQRRFERSTCAAAVELLGPVDEETLETLYQAADALVFPSTVEGWGLVVLEAMASGLPVVASDIPVFREYLVDRGNALLVDPTHGQAIASAMLELERGPELCRRLRSAGLATAERFTWRRCAQKHEGLYRRFLAETPRPPAAEVVPLVTVPP